MANDTDPDGGPKTIASATQPAHGTVAVAGGGPALTYTPNPNYCNERQPDRRLHLHAERRLDRDRGGDGHCAANPPIINSVYPADGATGVAPSALARVL